MEGTVQTLEWRSGQEHPGQGYRQHGKNILVKDIGNTVSHILPAVLSTHLNSDNRNFHEGIYAKHLRYCTGDTSSVARVVAQNTQSSKLVLKTAADGGTGNEVSCDGPDELVTHLNRTMLVLHSVRDAPPVNSERAYPAGELDVSAWAIQAAAAEWQQVRAAEGAEQSTIEAELTQGQFPQPLLKLQAGYNTRMLQVLADLGVAATSGELSRSYEALGLLTAHLADAPAWAEFITFALQDNSAFCERVLDKLVLWVERKKGHDHTIFDSIKTYRTQASDPFDEAVAQAAKIIATPSGQARPTPTLVTTRATPEGAAPPGIRRREGRDGQIRTRPSPYNL